MPQAFFFFLGVGITLPVPLGDEPDRTVLGVTLDHDTDLGAA